MSLNVCIPDLVSEGKITQEQGEQLDRLFGEARTEYRKSMGDAAADAAASKTVLEQMEKQAKRAKTRKLQQVQAQHAIMLDMMKYGSGAGNVRALDANAPGHLGKAAEALLVRSEYAPYMNVEYQARAILGQAHSTMRGVIMRHRRTLLGNVRDRAGVRDIVRELFEPGSTGNSAAREFAEAWSETAEMLRKRFNAAGGDIPALKGWGLPQGHDAIEIEKAGFDAWSAFITPLLDRQKMLDRSTGLPFSDEGFQAVLRDVYETIRTDGWAYKAPSTQPGGSALASKHLDHRFFHFKDADSWLGYQERFGSNATPFDTMLGHMRMMARDIALLERFGPNPQSALRWVQQVIEKDASLREGRGHADKAFKMQQVMQRHFDTITGASSRPESRRIALGFSALRAYQVATKLGAATLSATSDQATQILARNLNDLPIMKGWATQLKLLNPLDRADQELAMRMMLTAEDAANMGAMTARMTGEELAGDVSQRLAEIVLRVSGLNAVTRSGRWAMGMDMLSHMTHERGKSFDALDAGFRDMFLRHGLDAGDWDKIRATPLNDERGARWILPEAVKEQATRDRMLRMIQSEVDYAVPIATVAVQSAMNAAMPRGTFQGEIWRTLLQFKSFPIGTGMMQYQRMMAQRSWNRATYAVQMMILTTALGAVALQLKEITKGRDFRPIYDADDPVNTAAFWGAAAMQGGGFGIFGDFFRSSTNRFGGGFADTLMGPAVQTGDTLIARPIGMAAAELSGKDANWGGWFSKAVKSEVPGMSLWWGRLALERLALDEMQRQIDPKHDRAWKQMEKYAEEQGQDYYWAPGAPLDAARSPDIGNLVKEE